MALTIAQIHAAADQIDKEGKRPTLAGVRTVLGGGSFSTIQEAMKSWSSKGDEEETTAEPIPADVAEAGERYTAALWVLAEKHAAAAFDLERETHRNEQARAAAELDDAIQAADEQARKVETMQAAFDKVCADRDHQIALLVEAERRASEHHQAQLLAEGVAEERAKTIRTLEHLLNKAKPAAKATRQLAHPLNIEAAHREIAQRAAEGEDMTNATIDPITSKVVNATK